MMQEPKLPKILEVKKDEDLYEKLASFLEELELESPILVTCGSKGHTLPIAEKLCKKTPRYKLKGPFSIKSATSAEGSRIAELIKNKKAKTAMSVGGGIPEDTTKFAAHFTRIPLIHTMTSIPHDGIASSRCSLKGGDEKKEFRSLDVDTPKGVILSYEIVGNSPVSLTLNGMGDVLGKYTAVRDWELYWKMRKKGELPKIPDVTWEKIYLKDDVVSLYKKSAKSITGLINYMEEREIPMTDSPFYKETVIPCVAHACIDCSYGIILNNSTIGASGSDHLLSHALDRIAQNPASHGRQVAYWTAYIMRLYEECLKEKIGIRWKRYLKKMKYVGLPTNALELGIESTTIVRAPQEALKMGRERGRYTILEYVVSKGYSLDTVETSKILSEMEMV